MLQVGGNSIEDCFTDVGNRQDDEDDTFNKNGCQCLLPAVAHAQNDSVSKVGVQTHCGSQRKGMVGKYCHQDGANRGSDCSCSEDCAAVHAGSGKDAGVNCQDVSHGHKHGDTGHNLGLHIGVAFFQMKDLVKIHDDSLLFYYLELLPL